MVMEQLVRNKVYTELKLVAALLKHHHHHHHQVVSYRVCLELGSVAAFL